ncbi:unnamed protein product [Closterium sp. Naga37s-1]|nr:unnamed protein product [Closterium sp. Naga37s-1]
MSAENEALFKFSNLPILGGGFVFLALPCIITHAITKHSPLHGMSLAMMERADIEFLVLIEGVDAPTSAKLQARHSYSPCDIKFNHRFSTMVRRSPSGIRRVDFTKFHDVQPVPATLRRPHFLPHAPSWENLRNLSSLSSLPSVLRHPTAVSTDKLGAIMGRKDAPHPFPAPDAASASQVSLAYPPSVSAAAAAAAAGDSTAPVAADTIRKNSSFMNILSLGFGPGLGWGGGVWGSGVWGGGVLWSGGAGTGADEGSRGTVAAGRGSLSATGNTASDAVRGGSVDASTSGVAAEDWGRVRECRATSDSAAVGGGAGGGRSGGQGHKGGAMFLPLAGMEHELSMASLPPVFEGSSGSSSPASVPPAVISNSGVFNRSGVWNAAHVGTWSMEATAEAAASGAVVLAPVAIAAASTAVIARDEDAAATVGTAAGSAAQAHAFEGRKQMRRMVKRGSTERWDRIGGGMTTEQGRLSRRVSFEVSPVAELVGEGGAQQGAEPTAGRECASVAPTAAVLDGGWSRRHEDSKELTQRADRQEIEEMGAETPNKKGRREQRDSGGRRHGRTFSEPPIPVPSRKRNSISSSSSMSGGIGVGGRRSSGAGKQERSSGASGLPGCWTDPSPLLLMNSFSVRSASHMLEMDALHRIAVAEKREQQWRSLVVDLAIKVQSSKALHAPDVDCHPLLNRAKEFLEKAAEEDDVIVSKSNVDSIPVLSQTEVAKRLAGHKHPNQQNYRAFYSSVIGGITKDPAAMVIPIDDHMAHRGHAVFDTAIICSGVLYELDEHVDRFMKSARAARIEHSYSREELKAIIIRTVAVSGVRDGSTRYWLSVGPGGFTLSTKECPRCTFYVMVVADNKFTNLEARVDGVTVATSSVPMKAPMFSTMKNVNYMPNTLVKKEAEERGVFEGIWIDENGNVGEGPSMNVAFVNDRNEFLVPEFSRVLAGCTMKRVLALAEELLEKDSVPRISRISHRPVSESEARQCKEMMLVGSGVLVTPVIRWDDQVIASGSPGAITMALRKLLAADLHGGYSHIQVNYV